MRVLNRCRFRILLAWLTKGSLTLAQRYGRDQAGFFKGIIKAKNVTSLRSLYIKAYCEPMVNSS